MSRGPAYSLVHNRGIIPSSLDGNSSRLPSDAGPPSPPDTGDVSVSGLAGITCLRHALARPLVWPYLWSWNRGLGEGRDVMLRLCTICARGGSRGLPDKNIRTLAGKPLIAHSILQAKASGLFDRVAVSSDSAVILETARTWGADVVVERPAVLASDTAGKLPAIRHAWLAVEAATGLSFDLLADLDCTSPLRRPDDIVGAVRLLEDSGAHNVITGVPAHRSPYFNLVEVTDGIAHLSKPLPTAILRRQDSPCCYDQNASIYVWSREPFLTEPFDFDATTRLYEMPRVGILDIDTEVDFAIMELLWQRQQDQHTETAP